VTVVDAAGFRRTGDAFLWLKERLEEVSVEEAEREALFMLAHLEGAGPSELLARLDEPLDVGCIEVLDGWVERRARHEPLQYILGSTEFWSLEFRVTPDVLIPRPETELLVEEGIRFLRDHTGGLVLDLCTGSGCVAVSIARELPEASVLATDVSAAALDIARENARSNDVAERIVFLEGDLFAALEGRGLDASFDLIVSNPPYIASSDVDVLQPEVSLYEPRSALDGGEDGLSFIRRIVEDAPRFLRPGGLLLVEIGNGQAEDVGRLMEGVEGLDGFEVRKDYSGADRVVAARCTRPSQRAAYGL